MNFMHIILKPQLITIQSGNVLIEAVKEKHYNLALLDIDMTPLNGFDTCTIYMFHFIRYKNSFRNFT